MEELLAAGIILELRIQSILTTGTVLVPLYKGYRREVQVETDVVHISDQVMHRDHLQCIIIAHPGRVVLILQDQIDHHILVVLRTPIRTACDVRLREHLTAIQAEVASQTEIVDTDLQASLLEEAEVEVVHIQEEADLLVEALLQEDEAVADVAS